MGRISHLGWAVAIVVLCTVACGDGGNSGPLVPDEQPPRAPSGLQVLSTSPTQILLGWRDNTNDETGFRIERSADSPNSFAQQDTVPRNITQYTDGALEQGRTYYYRVRSYVRGRQSDPTDAVWAVAVQNTTPNTPRPLVPTNGQRDLEPGFITLQWSGGDADAGDQALYDVYFGSSLGAMVRVASSIPETQFAVVSEIQLNKHYFWQVIARDTRGAMAVPPIWGFNTRIERASIPAGYVIMGSLPVADHPGDPVYVEGFEMDKYEVTNQQYVDWLNEIHRVDPPRIRASGGQVFDPGLTTLYAETIEANDNAQITYNVVDSLFSVIPGKEDFPVVAVSWYGADAYAAYFDRRLPTEAEWEMAARGNSTENGDSLFTISIGDTAFEQIRVGKGRTYPWGEEASTARANCRDSGDPYESQPRVRSTPVGFYTGEVRGGYQTQSGATPDTGIHDLAGNVKEWTADWFGPYAEPHNPPIAGLHKVIRGGGWDKGIGSLQTWRRDIVEPTMTDWSIGFRTVKSLD